MRYLVAAIVLLGSLALPWPTAAQTGCAGSAASIEPAISGALAPSGEVALRLEGAAGGAVTATAISGATLAHGEGPSLVLGEVGRPRRARLILGGPVHDVALSGGLAYVAAGPAGLVVVDVRNPAAPRLLGTLRAGEIAASVAVAGGRAVLGTTGAGAGLSVIDVADPTRPRLIGRAATYGSPADLVVAGSSAYVAGGLFGGLEIFDLSDPAAPVSRARLALPGAAVGLALSGSRALVAGDRCGLQVVDLSDPALPRLLGAVDTGGAARAVQAAGGLAYVAAGSEVRAYTLGSGLPALRDGASLGGAVGTLAVSGTTAYAATERELFLLNLAAARLDPAFAGASLGAARAVGLAGGQPYAAVGEVATPVDLAAGVQAGAGLALGAAPRRLAASGAVLYGATGAAGLALANTAAANERYGPVPIPGSVGDLQLLDERAYLAAGSAGLQIIGLTNPLSPVLEATVPIPGLARALAVAGDLAVVADGEALHTIDLAARAPLGTLGLPGAGLEDVALLGGTVAVAVGTGGLIVIDITDETSPTLQGSYPGFSGYAVLTEGSRALVAAGTRGLLVFDVATPGAPRLVGAYDTPGTALDLAAGNGLIYVADSEGGLLALRLLELPERVWLPAVRG
ncbi:MAG: hypothetical protein OHK0015_00610 [Chloroflexi bacterium OHK40]